MPEPPPEFMPVREINWRHDYRQGVHDGFYWLQSRQIEFWDFFAWMKPPAKGFRLLVTTVDGSAGGYSYEGDSGWTLYGAGALSPILDAWPNLVCTGNGEATFVLDATVQLPDINEILQHFEDADGYEPLDDLNIAKIQNFWRAVQRLNPLFYVSSGAMFSLVSRHKHGFAEFIGSDGFIGLESALQVAANHHRLKVWNNYWETLGPERGPERCVHPGCERLRISLAVRCLRHQLESTNPDWFRPQVR